MWAISSTRFFFSGREEFLFSVKPLFHFFLWVNFQVSQFLGPFPIDLARVIWSLISIFCLYFTYEILKSKRVTFGLRLLGIFLLLATSTWVYRSGEVRSDILATFCLLFALYLRDRTSFSFLFFTTLFVISLLVSPKSILVWICCFPLFDFKLRKQNSTFAFLILIILAGLGIYFLSPSMLNAAQFFFSQFDAQKMGFAYWSITRMEHIVRFHQQNFLFALLLIGALLMSVRLLYTQAALPLERQALRALLLLLLLFYLYPDPLPFFLASLLPLILIPSLLILNTWKINLSPRLIQIAVVLLSALSLYWHVHLYRHKNKEQRQVVEWAQKALGDNPLLVFDPTGILFSPNSIQWFLGPANHYNDNAIQLIERESPEVILYTNKFHFLGGEGEKILADRYVKFSTSIYLRGLIWPSFKDCHQVFYELKSLFFRNDQFSQPVVLWEYGPYKETFSDVPIDMEAVCSLKRDEKYRYIFIPLQLHKMPAASLDALFKYDSRF